MSGHSEVSRRASRKIQMSNYQFDVLVRNKPITKYRHEGLLYVEGRPGSEFTVRIRNNTGNRVLAVLSVDGLSVMDGKEATYESGGYVIDPFDSLKIPGWRLDDDDVAKFQFTKKKKSYANKSGKPGNVGVIGCAIFEEQQWYTFTACCPSGSTGDSCLRHAFYASRKTLVNGSDPNDAKGSVTSYSISCDDSIGESTCTIQACDTNSASGTTSNSLTEEQKSDKVTNEVVVQNIGAEFGKMSSHKVNTVEFQAKDQPTELFVIHYDDQAGLKARGTDLSRKVKIANPFPAQPQKETGCQPPKEWVGHYPESGYSPKGKRLPRKGAK